MEVVYGGAKEGAFLCNHAAVKSIHLTGSAATYDAVVWGKHKKALVSTNTSRGRAKWLASERSPRSPALLSRLFSHACLKACRTDTAFPQQKSTF